jgi:hypothetical protein
MLIIDYVQSQLCIKKIFLLGDIRIEKFLDEDRHGKNVNIMRKTYFEK